MGVGRALLLCVLAMTWTGGATRRRMQARPTPAPTVPPTPAPSISDSTFNTTRTSGDSDADDDSTFNTTRTSGYSDADDDSTFNTAPTSGDSDADDDSPVGAIVGGVVGGLVFVAAAITLAFLFMTGRLKPCECCSPSTPVVVAGPAAGTGVATVSASKAYPEVRQSGARVSNGEPAPAPHYPVAAASAAPAPADASATYQYPEVK